MNHTQLQTLLRLSASRAHDENQTYLNSLRGIARALSRVTTADTTLLTSDGGTLDATHTQIDLSAGTVMVGGTAALITALNDQDIVTDLGVLELDGTLAARLADAAQIEVAIVAVLVNDAVVLRLVQSAEHATAAVAPTAAEVQAALSAAAEADWVDTELGVIVARCKFARAGAVITTTHYSGASTASLAQERAAGILV